MIFLNNFEFIDEDRHYKPLLPLYNRCTSDEYYPLGIFNVNFTGQRIRRMDFEDITILYGGNGSGKTTLLNIMAEKLGAFRNKRYTQTEGFAYFIEHCYYEYDEKPLMKKFLASDDIFDYILTVREENRGVKKHKLKEAEFHCDAKEYRKVYPDGIHLDFENPDVNDNLKFERYMDARRKTKKQYVRSRAGEMQRQFSNGENALMFFDKEIEKDALYFLDEPENSMSPKFQLELKTLIEDSVRYKNCQFVIATHSPFILSLHNAKIYNLDVMPVTVEHWYELENVRYYYDFFKKNRDFFEDKSYK